ncbi:protein SET DOMAIN GROUP 41-like isoform X1 [Camellia sinensis]|uniref:protein SET DOMAIN GROUP 41-like isoform X1 n=1 Tax=Camellia sinensis TaxID=4442 RepID=UPI0010368A48|nr:protein SET DOMAIN GROUP 41-like isoform X1 [Camellia sinensis]XP_028125651.1 protein SET DOMAIN GROUP 41-like isoform X1 [Camellia sinensis]XP_028125652.1 protein SET DOMAIN GROUP 41-like isoform X1 [Camellia sinensis]XP_028125653.1 protein SET DOMAIN GROUP 41-like isoform X1 [Camellia sinensis]
MEIRASEDISIGQDLTPPLAPLAFSLHSSSLLSHCSACFSPLSPPPHLPFPNPSSSSSSSSSVLYCSPQCSEADSDLHLSSAEHHLLCCHFHGGCDTSDLRAALRLIRRFELLNLISRQNYQFERIGGLMSNRDKLMSSLNEEEDGDVLARIKDGAKAMAMARRMRDGLALECSGLGECVLEEVVLCVVLTNAVEVQISGGGPAVGIAVYDTTFSWINHSCSPNACYWFLQQNECSGGASWSRIVPASSDGIEEMGNGNKCESTKVRAKEYGPRIIVGSIKAINKGEEVSVAYTDLLQPKAMRQSELWLKYRFSCSCQRCNAWPPTYVDHTLQEISAVNCNCANLSSDHNYYRYEAITRLTDNVDDAITEYLTFGNPKSCCEKLENLLTHGLLDGQFESKEEKSKKQFWLHPLHHLSLSAYTTLASAYKTRASDLLAVDPEMDKLQLEAFDMSRTSAAYSFLLAGATHHLFLSESSLVTSVANFWTSAGESLLNVARSSVWKLLAKRGLTIAELPHFPGYKCCNCALVNMFETNFAFNQARNVVFEDISREFLNCITSITPKVWTFLIQRGCYLKIIEDPIDFRWVGTMMSFRMLDCELGEADAKSSVSGGEACVCIKPENINLFQLGVHCILYGGFLSSICCGKESHLACDIQNLSYG